jgi:hypothetical protein
MAHRLSCCASILLGAVVAASGQAVLAEDGPLLMGPDALPPRVTPEVNERRGEVEGTEISGDLSRLNDDAPSRRTARNNAPTGRAYTGQSPNGSQARVPSNRQAMTQGQCGEPVHRQPQGAASSTPWSQPGRRIDSGDRAPSNGSNARPTPQQVARYRAQMQQRNAMAKNAPRQQQAANQPRPGSYPSRQSGPSPATIQPNRNFRSYFEPPAARTAQAPGRPRQIGYPGTPGMNGSGQSISQNRAMMYGNYPTGHPSMNYGNISARPVPTRVR